METGKARIVYLHFAFLGEESRLAALASECAGEQAAFWSFHEILYERQQGINEGTFAKENLASFIEELGLDTARFSTCLDSGRYMPQINGDFALGMANGVDVTPTIFFFKGDKLIRIEGPKPFSDVAPIIEELLSESAQE